MSDLGGGAGRASNGGARTGGPVPVGSNQPAGMKTPRDIMRERNAREARRQQEAQQREEDQRRLAEERRRSAERRAAAMTGAVPRFSQASSQYSQEGAAPQAGYDGSGDRRSSRIAGEVAGTNVLGEPTGRAMQDPPHRRGPSISQQEQPRPAPTTAGATRRTQPGGHARQQSQSATAGAVPGPSAQGSTANTAQGESQRNTQSSFPHAFERWETLSSHWEGLTSYWLHKLEQNTEEIRETVPNASTLNRQITDLSAAGANLFHAVVELQRLRASSERKFQRWFFETRADNEKNREIQAGLERQLKIEQQARAETGRQQTDNSIAVENAKKEVSEMRRELMISKDEARRAWEELGRRNQESLDTAQSLKEGRVTMISGVQVVPYYGGPASRTGSASQSQQRPQTREGAGYSGGTGFSQPGAAGLQSPDDQRQYYRDDAASPTNTDPFTDSGRQQQPPLHHEGGTQSLAQGTYQPYPMGTPTSAATAATAVPAAQYQQVTSPRQQRAPQAAVTSPEAQQFYQHIGAGTSLHSGDTSSSQNQPRAAARTAPARSQDVRSEPSYVDTLSEGGTEYDIDATGNIRRDEHGRPIPYQQARRRQQQQERSSESEEDFDTERERAILPPEAPSVPGTSAQAMESFTPTTGAEAPDYEGEGFEGYQQYVPRHHHPTRLSDVLEEEEERSSRRTGPD